MRQLFILLIMLMAHNTNAEDLDLKKVKGYEHQLQDVMEIIDTNVLKSKLVEVEQAYQRLHNEINTVRLGIIYHEVALNLSFFSGGPFRGYAKKSYDILNEVWISRSTTPELMPFVASYRASALSLMGAETRNLKLLNEAFREFEIAVDRYGHISYCPRFMRGSVSENLPWFFFSKRKFAKSDMEFIIEKQASNENYANPKIMSFTYWAWANQHRSKKYRQKALEYLELAIQADPGYEAGRKRAEELKEKLIARNLR